MNFVTLARLSFSKDILKKVVRSIKKYGLKTTIKKVVNYGGSILNDKSNVFVSSYNKIKTLSIDNLSDYVEQMGGMVVNKELLKEGKKYVLMISHEASLTGAPMALLYAGKCFQKMGYRPIFFTPTVGEIIDELKSENIVTIVYPGLDQLKVINNYNQYSLTESLNFIIQSCKLFDFVVVNTAVNYHIINQYLLTDVKVLWWIHESEEVYKHLPLENLPIELTKNIEVFCVSESARNTLLKFRPLYETKLLSYPLTIPSDSGNRIKNGKMIFLCVGAIQPRKAQDHLVRAIELLDSNIRNKCDFYFIGKSLSNEILGKVITLEKMYPNNVHYLGELSPSKLNEIYDSMDVLVCPSIDDPLPIVVTESLGRGKLVICSDAVGTSRLIEENDAGILFKAGDVGDLADKISKIASGQLAVDVFEKKSIKVFNEHFSNDAFIGVIEKFVSNIERKVQPTISVIIPTFNAGVGFENLIKRITEQEGLSQLEVIVVDSGSQDGTIEICRNYKVKLIEITQSQFSHSYARNLGASVAKNEILLFMTQDALPSSKSWIIELIKPILDGSVVATTSYEQCPDNIDLFYKYLSFGHNNFMQSGQDICSANFVYDEISLRRNSSLNDTNCAVRRDVFELFKYRYDFAEDLDLGIRLIKKGYRLKYIDNNPVIHGHNRNPEYYLKRSYVESKSLAKILNRSLVELNDNEILSLFFAYFLILNSLENLKSVGDKGSLELFCDYMRSQEFSNIDLEERFLSHKDERLIFVVMRNLYFGKFNKHTSRKVDFSISRIVLHEIENGLIPFLSRFNISCNEFDVIEDLVLKEAYFIFGQYLSRCSVDDGVNVNLISNI